MKIHTLQDEETLEIAGEKITFFDVHPKGNQLYGFEIILKNGKKLIFLGDETCNPILYDRLKDGVNLNYITYSKFFYKSLLHIIDILTCPYKNCSKKC